MQHSILWRSDTPVTFVVVDKGPDHFMVTAYPVVTNSNRGTTVGLVYSGQHDFGYWSSSQYCDLIIAWRVAQLLPMVKTIHSRDHGRVDTLRGLVFLMEREASRQDDWPSEIAMDLGMSVQDLRVELNQLDALWPTALAIRQMWVALPESDQDRLAPVVRQAVRHGHVVHDEALINLIVPAEERVRKAALQMKHEEELIAKGLDFDPMNGLQRLMLDIGVTNLVYTVDESDPPVPSHFSVDDMDRQVMSRLIGLWGRNRCVPLRTTVKGPDDRSAHCTSTKADGKLPVFGANFGKETTPTVVLARGIVDLVSVRYNRRAECFMLVVRPTGAETGDDDQEWTIEGLRRAIGVDYGLDGPLMPGVLAPWVTPRDTAAEPDSSERKGLITTIKEKLKI